MISLLQLWCCGLTNYTDWQGTPWGQGHPNKLPYSCCQFTFKGVCAAHDESAFMHTTVSIFDQAVLYIQGFHFCTSRVVTDW